MADWRDRHFRCPRCGGWAFGSVTKPQGDTFVIQRRTCNSTTNGVPLSARGPGERMCGWEGQDEECFVPTEESDG